MTRHTALPPSPIPNRSLHCQARRIVVLNDSPCLHCQSTSFLVDPDLGITCTQCAKPPHRPRRKEPPTL